MQRADLTTRAVAAFVDLLIIIGLVRLPDVLGFLSASGYLLLRDGLFDRQSVGKKLVGLRISPSEPAGAAVSFRESLIRNTPLAASFLLFLVPYAGWVLGPLVLGIEGLTALGDDRGMRVGDHIARTAVTGTATAWGASPSAPSAIEEQPDFDAPPEPNSMKSND